jgi:6-phosphogluconolactonase
MVRIESIADGRLATRASVWVANAVWSAIAERGEAHVAVSGGSTPAPMFALLAATDLPWQSVHIWQVDERVAPDGDPARNARQLEPLQAAGAIVHLMRVAATHLAGAAMDYGGTLPRRLDVVHLGLGDDGHTASWPPGDPVVDTSAPCTVIGPYNGHLRMTLTPPVINAARARMLLIAGESKRSPLSRLVRRDASLPASRVQSDGTLILTDLQLDEK